MPSEVLLPECDLSDTGFLRLPRVIALTGLSKSTIYSLCATGRLAKPLRVTRGASAWRVEDVRAFIADPTGSRVKSSGSAAERG